MAELLTSQVIWTLVLSGLLPAVLWLLFWLREDRFKPEPVGLLILTFLGGAFMVFLVLPFEQLINSFGLGDTQRIMIFAAIEEIAKFSVVFLIDFSSPYLDEPVDYAVYLITGAIGFSAAENVLFLLEPAAQQNVSFVIETGILRFVGATVLHTILAAILGIIIGFVFYKSRKTKVFFGMLGLGIVIILHTFFNYFIIKYVEINGLLTLAILWLVTLIIIGLFEQVRRVRH